MYLIKIGGSKSLNLDAIADDIAVLWEENPGKVIIVHGASKYRNEIAQSLGIEVKKITSASGVESYFSNKEFMDVFLMSYAGLLNKRIVSKLISKSVSAVGLSGIDGKLWLAKRKSYLYVKEKGKLKLIQADLSGKVIGVNTELLNLLLKNNYLPVICSPAVSEAGEILNVDNDAAISEMIKPLKIQILVSLFSAPGILKDLSDEASVVKNIKFSQLDSFLPSAKGTMKKKIIFLKKAFENGLKTAYLGDGRVKNPVINLLKRKGGSYIHL